MVCAAAGQFNNGFVAVFYLLIYFFLSAHFFSVLFIIKNRTLVFLTDLRLVHQLPTLVAGCTCIFVAMSGLPPFAGFWIKLNAIILLFQVGDYYLSILLLCSGFFLLYFYFQNYRFSGAEKHELQLVPVILDRRAGYIIHGINCGILINVFALFFFVDAATSSIIFNLLEVI
jgi:NADH:ubiquinone oxidoreductase subunit 2 (subunit N)